jgi:hypothetical protein
MSDTDDLEPERPERPYDGVRGRGPGFRIEPAAAHGDAGLDRGSGAMLRDPRFDAAPLTRAEVGALTHAPDADARRALLGAFQEARLADGRLPPPAQDAAKALIHDTLTARTLVGEAPETDRRGVRLSAP